MLFWIYGIPEGWRENSWQGCWICCYVFGFCKHFLFFIEITWEDA